MLKSESIFHFGDKFELESGENLPGFQLKYTTLGQLNTNRSNVIWICHALTGSSDFTDWWKGLFTENSPFNPKDYFIICANTLGGCYGSTGPLSINSKTGKPYYHTFPFITNRDIVRGFDLLRQYLNISKIHTLLGGSLGGQQVLEWAIEQPEVFERIIPVATNAFHSPWGIAINEAQRMTIESDSTWKSDDTRAGLEGMKAARAIGMISFRTYDTFLQTQREKTLEKTDDFRASSYQRYQGQKLSNRFNAFSYWVLTKVMDSHQVGRNRKSIENALRKIKAKTLVIGIDTDLLFPIREQEYLAKHIEGARLEIISSLHGHDGFLVEFDQFKNIVQEFLKREFEKATIV